MIVGYDTITPSEFRSIIRPPGNPLVALLGYDDGRWNDFAQIVRDYPACKHASYAVRAGDDGDILDIERGDASPDQFAAWARRHKRGRLDLPAAYCSASVVATVEANARAGGFRRNQYLIVSAHYTGHPHICAPQVCGFPQADATQWDDKGPHGENVDRLLFGDGFFPTGVQAATFAGSVILKDVGAHWTIRGTPGPFRPEARPRTLKFTGEFDTGTGAWRIEGIL